MKCLTKSWHDSISSQDSWRFDRLLYLVLCSMHYSFGKPFSTFVMAHISMKGKLEGAPNWLRFHGPTYLQNLANISCDILRFKVNSESKKEGARVGMLLSLRMLGVFCMERLLEKATKIYRPFAALQEFMLQLSRKASMRGYCVQRLQHHSWHLRRIRWANIRLSDALRLLCEQICRKGRTFLALLGFARNHVVMWYNYH